MRRRAPGAVLLLGTLVSIGRAAGAAAAPLPDADERWIQARTTHFTLFSNASESRTLEIGTSLERFRASLARIVSGLRVNSPVPTFIYVFKNDASFRPYKKRVGIAPANVSGAFAAHRDGNYVGIDASPPTDPWATVYHEYIHHFLDNNFTDIPLWFNEGIAECYSSFAAGSREVEIGRPIDGHASHLRSSPWIPFPDLFAMNEDSKDYNEGDRQGTFYAESWALVHYLAWGRPDAGARGVEFLAQFPPRAGLRDALKPLVGPDWSALQAKVFNYVRRGRFTYSILKLEDVRVDPPSGASPMSRAEVLTRLGDYLLRTQPERSADAEAHFQAAIQADPAHAPAYSGMGCLRDERRRHEDAAGYYERALALRPDDPLTLFLYAESLLDRFTPAGTITRRTEGGPPPAELARARDLYRRSIRLRPDVAEAYAGLGATFTFDDDNLSEGIAALEKARSMLPSRMDVVINLAGLYARSGDRDRTRDLVENVLARSGDRQEAEAGREILLEADLQRAAALVNKGEVDGGVAIMKEVMQATRDAALRKKLAENLERIEEVQVRNRQIETYNRAVALANKGEYRKAAAILERLLPDLKDPKLAQDARILLKRVRQAGEAAPGR